MPEDRLRRDYDIVENLEDLIDAREERKSAFADDVDALDDIDYSGMAEDPSEQLTYPHPRTRADEYGREGINTELMGTPNKEQVEFDWQDSAEEMLPADPEPSEGMGADGIVESLAHVEATDLVGPAPSVDVHPETDTAATEQEAKDYELDGGKEEPQCPPPVIVPVDSAMDTDSDEMDFTIEDRFAGEVDRETAEFRFEQMREATEGEEVGGEEQRE